MPRVVGIDPGTITIDVCGLDRGELFLDRTFPTAIADRTPSLVEALLDAHAKAPLDLVVGPSGYGLPVTAARDLTETELTLAFLPDGGSGGIEGLRSLVRALAVLPFKVVVTPGVIHLDSVPAHRKINRVDMGTADKVCATALAIHEQAARRAVSVDDVSLILVELGGAFTAASAVDQGRIVDGVGGTMGPMGWRAAGGLDGEVAFLAGTVTKALLFGGGAASVAGVRGEADEALIAGTGRGRVAREAYVEGVVKTVASLRVSLPAAIEVVLSGRLTRDGPLCEEISRRLTAAFPEIVVRFLTGFAGIAKHAAQGAALVADGLAGGRNAPLVDRLGIRDARGSILDHLYVISPETARQRLGLKDVDERIG